ncbi:hypothetical protein CBR_g8226 [Chara braunii]|uniref:Uncharacterized protein n=1 Tax=Chara braunii TaxID=69332 RepID=A0A388KLJ1_CHABU|nr:hypothetical protein CBR_g8226 [Chara braunii]|eukprot:GBG70924.1 hypothetical protein CBR_g8226 [Chara braunii]
MRMHVLEPADPHSAMEENICGYPEEEHMARRWKGDTHAASNLVGGYDTDGALLDLVMQSVRSRHTRLQLQRPLRANAYQEVLSIVVKGADMNRSLGIGELRKWEMGTDMTRAVLSHGAEDGSLPSLRKWNDGSLPSPRKQNARKLLRNYDCAFYFAEDGSKPWLQGTSMCRQFIVGGRMAAIAFGMVLWTVCRL